jgi:hypothetical protein
MGRFIQFNPAAVNQETDAQYLADSQRAGGYGVDNTVPSPLLNKATYQPTTFCTAFNDMMLAKGYTLDDADVNVLAAVLANVITDADLEPNVMVVGYSPTPTFNAAEANGFQMTLAGNITASSIAGVSPGQLIAFYFAQDATGGRTVSWPSGFVGALQPDPAANSVSVQMFRADLSSVPRAVTAMVSNNGTFTGPLTASSFTLTGGGAAGSVLTWNGSSFVPVVPSKYLASGVVSFPGHTYGHSEQQSATYNLGTSYPSGSVSVVSPQTDLGTDFNFSCCIVGAILTIRILNSSYNSGYTLPTIAFNYRILP